MKKIKKVYLIPTIKDTILAFTDFTKAWNYVCEHPDCAIYSHKGKPVARFAPALVPEKELRVCESETLDPHTEKMNSEIDAICDAVRDSIGIRKYEKIRQDAMNSNIPLSMSFAVKVEFSKHTVTASSTGRISVKGEGMATIPDFDQPEFDFSEEDESEEEEDEIF